MEFKYKLTSENKNISGVEEINDNQWLDIVSILTGVDRDTLKRYPSQLPYFNSASLTLTNKERK